MTQSLQVIKSPDKPGRFNASSCMNDTWPAHSEDTNVGNHSWDDLNGLYSHVTASNPWG